MHILSALDPILDTIKFTLTHWTCEQPRGALSRLLQDLCTIHNEAHGSSPNHTCQDGPFQGCMPLLCTQNKGHGQFLQATCSCHMFV